MYKISQFDNQVTLHRNFVKKYFMIQILLYEINLY